MAAPSFIAKNAAVASNTGTITLTHPLGTLAGDGMFILIMNAGGTPGNTNPATLPAGWTQIDSFLFTDNPSAGPDGQASLWFKISDGSETGLPLVITRNGPTGGAAYAAAQMYTYRTAGGGALVVGDSGSVAWDGTSTVKWNALDVAGGDSTAIAFAVQFNDTSLSAPSGYTQSASDIVNVLGDAGLFANTKQNATSTGIITQSGGDALGWGTFHIAIFEARGRSFIVN
jgi:hypothetical protein